MTLLQLILRAVLVIVIAAIAGGAAYLWSVDQPKRYEATTRLLLNATTPELEAIGYRFDAGEEDRRLANAVFEVRSFEVARRTAEVLQDPSLTPDRIAADVEVAGERGSDVIRIAAEGASPAEAAELATAYRRAFTFRRQEAVRERARNAIAALRDALRNLPRRSRLTGRGDQLRSQIGALQIFARAGGNPFVVEGVRAFADPVSPETRRNTLFGLLFGAVLGIGLVALRDATRAPADARRPDADRTPAPA